MSGGYFCVSCGKDFTSLRGFDAHRVGVHAYTFREGLALEPPREDGRRCLDTDELDLKGFELNSRGRWFIVADAERARRRFRPRRAGIWRRLR